MYKEVQCIMNISPLLIPPGESHKSLKWRESSGKGKTGKNSSCSLSQVTLRFPQLLFTV